MTYNVFGETLMWLHYCYYNYQYYCCCCSCCYWNISCSHCHYWTTSYVMTCCGNC